MHERESRSCISVCYSGCFSNCCWDCCTLRRHKWWLMY
nr:MAG TPA: carboxypeptidase inhibitor [Caudoviricetes sp.]